MEENGKNGKKGFNATIPAKVELLQSANVWVGDLGASVHCTNDRHGHSNTHKGNGGGTIGAYGKDMSASSIMDISGTWCNKFDKEQLKLC